jgi:hypothetical protein
MAKEMDKSTFITRGQDLATAIEKAALLAREWLDWNTSTAILDSIQDQNDPVFEETGNKGLTKANMMNFISTVDSLVNPETGWHRLHKTNIHILANH